jgi:hypothetical protein
MEANQIFMVVANRGKRPPTGAELDGCCRIPRWSWPSSIPNER